MPRSFADMFTDHWRAMIDVVALESNGSVERQWAYAREVIETPRALTFEEVAEVRQAGMDKIAEIVARSPATGSEAAPDPEASRRADELEDNIS